MRVLGTYSLKTKGPEPIAVWETSLSLAATKASDMTMQLWPARLARREASGAVSVRTTVASSGASTLAIEARSEALVEAVAGSTRRSKLNLTSLALRGVPSWKVTPGRSLKV